MQYKFLRYKETAHPQKMKINSMLMKLFFSLKSFESLLSNYERNLFSYKKRVKNYLPGKKQNKFQKVKCLRCNTSQAVSKSFKIG